MAPSSQELEPPTNAGRFKAFLDDDLQVVAPDDATFIVAVDDGGEHEIFRIHRPTLH